MKFIREEIPAAIGGAEEGNQTLDQFLVDNPEFPVEDDEEGRGVISAISQLPESLHNEYRVYVSRIYELRFKELEAFFDDDNQFDPGRFRHKIKNEVMSCLQAIRYLETAGDLEADHKRLLASLRQRLSHAFQNTLEVLKQT